MTRKSPGHRGLGSLDALPQKAGAVLKAAPKVPGPVVGGEQLAAQVPVAGLQVYPVEPSLLGQAGGLAHALHQAVEVVVGDDALLGDGAVLFKEGVVVGDQRRGHALGLAVPPGVGGLHDNHRQHAI